MHNEIDLVYFMIFLLWLATISIIENRSSTILRRETPALSPRSPPIRQILSSSDSRASLVTCKRMEALNELILELEFSCVSYYMLLIKLWYFLPRILIYLMKFFKDPVKDGEEKIKADFEELHEQMSTAFRNLED